MSRGIQIAKENHDIDETNQADLVVDTTTPLFKLYKPGTGAQQFNGTAFESYTITIPHELGYIPFFLFFMDRNPGDERRMVGSSESTPVNFTANIACLVTQVDRNNIKVSATALGTPEAGSYGYNYYIYYDSVNKRSGVDDD
jgi:hypothetical protein